MLVFRAFEWDFGVVKKKLKKPPCAVRGKYGILCTRSPRKGGAIFEKRELETKENYNVDEIGEKFLAKRIRAHDGCLGIRRL